MKDYMKKFICIMLAAAIGLFLMGCGSKEAPAEEPVQEDSEITMDDIEEMKNGQKVVFKSLLALLIAQRDGKTNGECEDALRNYMHVSESINQLLCFLFSCFH